jgi:hypothetical protein
MSRDHCIAASRPKDSRNGLFRMRAGWDAGRRCGLLLAGLLLGCLAGPAAAQEETQEHRTAEHSTADLAKAAQNPIANMISVPFQNNSNFAVGPHSKTQDVLNIQPVIPIKLNEDWNVITRWITPVISQPPLTITGDREFGLGDINPSFFFSPSKAINGVTWGIGPTFVFPTGTDKNLTAGKYSLGPTMVVVVDDGHWLYGFLINNVWSFTGKSNREEVKAMLLQPFANYNFPGGWYLTTSPIITANWQERSRERWTVPLGGGFGRVFKIGEQPVNLSLAAYYNVVKPNDAANWNLRAQLQFLFPR